MTTIKRALAALALLLLPQLALAQTFVLNSTSLSAAVTSTARTATLTAVTAATGSTFGAVSAGQAMVIDSEFIPIDSVSGSVVTFGRRGRPAAHNAGAVVYIAAPAAFYSTNPTPSGCTFASQGDPWVNYQSGMVYRCIASQWLNVIDSFQFVGPGNCVYSTTGGTLATPTAVTNVGVYEVKSNGLINSSATAPGTPVMQVATTNSGTATNTVSCAVPVPTRANISRGVYVADATWVYGVQQTDVNATQVAVEASGTMNGIVAFGKIVVPTAAASETSSTLAQARWDAGTMVLTPAKASFNNTVTTAGRFYAQKIAPATPAAMTTDGTAYYVNLTILCTATSATSIQVAGVLIHYQTVTGM